MKTRQFYHKVKSINDIKIVQESINYNAGAVCYVISRSFCKYLINNFFPVNKAIDLYIGISAKSKKHFTIKMDYIKKIDCYISPLLYIDCHMEDTTQDYKAKTIKKIKCLNTK